MTQVDEIRRQGSSDEAIKNRCFDKFRSLDGVGHTDIEVANDEIENTTDSEEPHLIGTGGRVRHANYAADKVWNEVQCESGEEEDEACVVVENHRPTLARRLLRKHVQEANGLP